MRKQRRAGQSGNGGKHQDWRESDSIFALHQAPHGRCCRVKRHRALGAVRQRLLDLGFVPNAEVEIIRVATLGDPIEVRIGSYFVALRKEEAERIEVEIN
ncbi:FeoA family protein [Desulfovibrio inopinatus]|uniref:FeoA family protein n=1 Tax=Desulfovibrio inopinatus TaxID=102109 RepID=UPI0009FD9D95|nr:FeoA family protein [Desulfovibrio inopinatus]